MHTGNDKFDESITVKVIKNKSAKEQKLEQENPKYEKNLLKNWPLMSAIMVYCVFQLHDTAYSEVTFPLRHLLGLKFIFGSKTDYYVVSNVK